MNRETKFSAPPRVDVWFDFACPQCFLATLELDRLAREQTLNIHWRSLMMRPPEAAPATPGAAEERRWRFAERLQVQHGVVLQPGPAGIDTHFAHLTLKYARARNKGGAFQGALMRAYWVEGRSIADLEVIKEIALTVDLDPADLAVRLNEPSYAEAVELDAQCASKVGIREGPALLFANKYLVSRDQPADAWRQVLHRVRAGTNYLPPANPPAGMSMLLGQKQGTSVLVPVGSLNN